MLQFLKFYSTFHVFDGAVYPYKPSRPIPLDPISHGNEGLFYCRKVLSMEICHSITAGDGGPSSGFQTHSNA